MKKTKKELIRAFLKDCTCLDCDTIQPYIWQNQNLCKRCHRKKFGVSTLTEIKKKMGVA